MPVNGMALAEAAAGGVLLFAGYKGIRVGSAFQAILSGKQPAADASLAIGTGTVTGTAAAGSGAVPSGSAGAAQAYAKSRMAAYGWTDAANWDALVKLWDRESNWDNRIWNGGSHAATLPAGSSGAYGIAQALPYSKMPKAAWPPGYGGQADAQAQVDWGLQYIRDTYHSPVLAWAHEQSAGWY